MDESQPGSTPEHDSTALLDAEGDPSNNGSFFVHSRKTLTQGLPPKVDNKALTRQRRRRTSPEDHAVLEAEYQRNPKPDKVTRANIVSRVSLGDKEVQIWFQNRRQNDRRRSKPLQPHEYLPSAAGSIAPQISHERSTSNPECAFDKASGGDRGESGQGSSFKPTLSPGASFGSGTDSDCNATLSSSQLDSSQTTVATEKSGDEQDVDESRVNPSTIEPILAVDTPSSGGKRKRSNSDVRDVCRSERRHTVGETANPPRPSLRVSLSFNREAILRGDDEKTPSPPKMRDPVRISFSADGEAVVRTANEPSPLKDRESVAAARGARLGTLRRCHSTASFGSSSGVSSLKEKLFGRSRDSRAWELHCDTDARSALSTSHGESGSNKGVFNPAKALMARRKSESGNARSLTSRTSTPDLYKTAVGPPPEKRAKLSRTMSSLGRLESDSRRQPSLATSKQQITKDGTKSFSEYHDGDSDKENWIPGTQVSSTRRKRPNNKRRTAMGLGPASANARRNAGNIQPLSTSRRPNGVQARPLNDDKTQRHLVEDERGVVAESQASNHVEEDLDCIQGLLSLSQGAWR